MRCDGCGAVLTQGNAAPLCPACLALTGALQSQPCRPRSAMGLWNSDAARAALASGDLAVIFRAYRAATGTTQRRLAEALGYDSTYISMIETGRRGISDVSSRLRVARCLGLPAQTLGVSDPDDADVAAMLQFGESVIRLAVIVRQSGHGAEAVNELWPLVTRLESRVVDDRADRDILHLLARARAELGVSLGYVLPDERLVSAARWTGRALGLAEQLGDRNLLAHALRVHGNELRKVERTAAAVARLSRSTDLVPSSGRAAALIQLARAAGELGDTTLFDRIVDAARRVVDAAPGAGLASPEVLHEVRLRGLMRTGRPRQAVDLFERHQMSGAAISPQWQAIRAGTIGEVFLIRADIGGAATAFQAAIAAAEAHRMPRQLQRTVRATARRLPDVAEQARRALDKLRVRRSLAPEKLRKTTR